MCSETIAIPLANPFGSQADLKALRDIEKHAGGRSPPACFSISLNLERLVAMRRDAWPSERFKGLVSSINLGIAARE